MMESSLENRYISSAILEDLNEKVVLVGGPRQVGKTTVSKDLISKQFQHSTYYNWDNHADRKVLMESQWPGEDSLLIFDEIHKYSRWKNWLKGQYDTYKQSYKFLVTGSAKLNVFKNEGDSLFGRHRYYCLHPFTYGEILTGGKAPKIKEKHVGGKLIFDTKTDTTLVESLLEFGGFPEPFLKQSQRSLRLWHNSRISLLVKDDIRSLEDVRDISLLTLFAEALPKRSAAMFSLNALREDLNVSHNAVNRWIGLLELVYYCYRVYPFHFDSTKSLKKEPKLYLWDWSEIQTEGERFENFIANHLLKFSHYIRDYFGFKIELNYLRTKDKKEVDFIVSIDKRPWFAVEVKNSQTDVSSQVHYFKEKLQIPFMFQVVNKPNIDHIDNGVRVISASKFLTALL